MQALLGLATDSSDTRVHDQATGVRPRTCTNSAWSHAKLYQLGRLTLYMLRSLTYGTPYCTGEQGQGQAAGGGSSTGTSNQQLCAHNGEAQAQQDRLLANSWLAGSHCAECCTVMRTPALMRAPMVWWPALHA